MDKKRQQNLRDAKAYFNNDLTKDRNDRYKDYRIDSELFNQGWQYGFDESHIELPENMKDNFSYKSGFEHAKRDLRNKIALIKMGEKHFNDGYKLDDSKYNDNPFFVQGYYDAMNLNIEDSTTRKRNGR